MRLIVADVWGGYGGRWVLSGLDFSVQRGEIYGLAGPNGSGKSTALKVVAGLLRAERGHVRLDGRELSERGKERLGYAPQAAALYPRLSCAETLRFFGRLYGVPRKELGHRVEEAIIATGLEEYRDARAHVLSGGWRQRLSLAAALVHDPGLLLLDEPATGLDPDVRSQVWEVVASRAQRGTSVLLASHGLAEMEARCHRVGVLAGGKIVAEGTPRDLRRLVPAIQIADLDVDDGEDVEAHCAVRGWKVRRRGAGWTVLLQRPTTLPELAREMAELSLRSLSLRPVTLEDVFLEMTGGRADEIVGADGDRRSATAHRSGERPA